MVTFNPFYNSSKPILASLDEIAFVRACMLSEIGHVDCAVVEFPVVIKDKA